MAALKAKPYCHKCSWDGRGLIGRSCEERTVEGEMGVAGGTVHYAGSVNLCQVCDYLYEKDIFFRLEVSTQAVRHISGVS